VSDLPASCAQDDGGAVGIVVGVLEMIALEEDFTVVDAEDDFGGSVDDCVDERV
jgi:hypothetical protein